MFDFKDMMEVEQGATSGVDSAWTISSFMLNHEVEDRAATAVLPFGHRGVMSAFITGGSPVPNLRLRTSQGPVKHTLTLYAD